MISQERCHKMFSTYQRGTFQLRYVNICVYPMLNADFRFWLVNNREI